MNLAAEKEDDVVFSDKQSAVRRGLWCIAGEWEEHEKKLH
jgi:hypothetical protein